MLHSLGRTDERGGAMTEGPTTGEGLMTGVFACVAVSGVNLSSRQVLIRPWFCRSHESVVK